MSPSGLDSPVRVSSSNTPTPGTPASRSGADPLRNSPAPSCDRSRASMRPRRAASPAHAAARNAARPAGAALSRASMKISRSVMSGTPPGLPSGSQCGMRAGITPRQSGKKSPAGRGPLDGLVQPGPGVRPQPVAGPRGDAQHGGRLGDRQAGEEPKVDQVGRGLVLGGEPGEGLVERDQVLRPLGDGNIDGFEFLSGQGPAGLQAPLAAGGVDEDAAHRFGSRGEEVTPTVPVL